MRIPKLTVDAPPQGDSASVAEAARLLVGAENPVDYRGPRGAHRGRRQSAWRNSPKRSRRQSSIKEELAFAPSADSTGGAALIRNADVILALEVTDLWVPCTSSGNS